MANGNAWLVSTAQYGPMMGVWPWLCTAQFHSISFSNSLYSTKNLSSAYLHSPRITIRDEDGRLFCETNKDGQRISPVWLWRSRSQLATKQWHWTGSSTLAACCYFTEHLLIPTSGFCTLAISHHRRGPILAASESPELARSFPARTKLFSPAQFTKITALGSTKFTKCISLAAANVTMATNIFTKCIRMATTEWLLGIHRITEHVTLVSARFTDYVTMAATQVTGSITMATISLEFFMAVPWPTAMATAKPRTAPQNGSLALHSCYRDNPGNIQHGVQQPTLVWAQTGTCRDHMVPLCHHNELTTSTPSSRNPCPCIHAQLAIIQWISSPMQGLLIITIQELPSLWDQCSCMAQ